MARNGADQRLGEGLVERSVRMAGPRLVVGPFRGFLEIGARAKRAARPGHDGDLLAVIGLERLEGLGEQIGCFLIERIAHIGTVDDDGGNGTVRFGYYFLRVTHRISFYRIGAGAARDNNRILLSKYNGLPRMATAAMGAGGS